MTLKTVFTKQTEKWKPTVIVDEVLAALLEEACYYEDEYTGSIIAAGQVLETLGLVDEQQSRLETINGKDTMTFRFTATKKLKKLMDEISPLWPR